MQALDLKIPPVLLFAAFGAAMYGSFLVAPSATFVVPGRAPAALALGLLGVAVAVAGVMAFRAARTTVNPLTPDAASTLVSTGVYRLSRNPMYLGFLLVLTAWSIYLSSIVALGFLPGFVAYMNQFQIKPEERALQARFGPDFAKYAAAVRRWL